MADIHAFTLTITNTVETTATVADEITHTLTAAALVTPDCRLIDTLEFTLET